MRASTAFAVRHRRVVLVGWLVLFVLGAADPVRS